MSSPVAIYSRYSIRWTKRRKE